MSILLIGLDEMRGPAIVERLVSEGDIVGVIEEDPRRGDLWRGLGAHVAIGTGVDPDLVERAAQHARSIVVFASAPDHAGLLEAVLEGARLAPGEPARILYVTDELGRDERRVLEGSAFDYVVLRTGRRGGRLRRTPEVDPTALAEAISAADDLAGEPRLVVDITQAEGRGEIGL